MDFNSAVQVLKKAFGGGQYDESKHPRNPKGSGRNAGRFAPKQGGRAGAQVRSHKPMKYEYYINLDERGSFYADVRDPSGKTVFEIKAGNELDEGESSIFDDGFMFDADDIGGLESYLKDLGILKSNDSIRKGN